MATQQTLTVAATPREPVNRLPAVCAPSALFRPLFMALRLSHSPLAFRSMTLLNILRADLKTA